MERHVNRRGVARREAIIEAAMELWSGTGSRGIGITAIADRAGVTRGGLLHHFGTKENLLLEVIAERDRRDVARLASAFTEGGLDTLRALPDIARAVEEHPGLTKLNLILQVENIEPDGPAHEYYVTRYQFLHDLFVEVIETGQARGEIRSDIDPEPVAAQIISFMEGAELRRHFYPAASNLVALYEDFTARLIRDLVTGPQDDPEHHP